MRLCQKSSLQNLLCSTLLGNENQIKSEIAEITSVSDTHWSVCAWENLWWHCICYFQGTIVHYCHRIPQKTRFHHFVMKRARICAHMAINYITGRVCESCNFHGSSTIPRQEPIREYNILLKYRHKFDCLQVPGSREPVWWAKCTKLIQK